MPEAVPSPAFDPLVALADQCVQCGLCLPACPTYRLERVEAESPRGRIALARAWALETIPATAAGDAHLDHCLACRRCEVVCPANVQYGALLVMARERQRQRRGPGLRRRTLEWLAARPQLLAILLSAYRHAWPLLPMRWRPLPRPPATVALPAPPGTAGASVAIFSGCVAHAYESGVRAALVRLAAASGVAALLPAGQGCCGTLHAHGGASDAAAALAARNRDAFAASDRVLTLASGCHEAVAAALHGGVVVEDALAFIAARGERLRFRETRERVALHLPCTQRNVVHSDAATRALLARIPGLDVVVLDAGYGCCGAAGTGMVTEPERAATHRQPLLDQLAASGATRLLSANIGCRLHFATGTQVPVQHPLEFLAQCLA
ncbi:heterodisulfide reductase-related iron-sulfur binding cluster [Luteimonas sp. 50]|uniref:Glycolate oxidase iron-sulfur subunit n=1 Tax=Cognatiluteimonas sedimenti TaxID=2927791 RepID=A0ABT0A6V8_9GAMM|nr:heterodisulfide reductase-related iron-sulfur binding cluster [Lysobacter sedimenti]MCJ0826711.1 heterodisulfide reductase-related iron-sulfur binding cluster [Lysobacter sedimenti]